MPWKPAVWDRVRYVFQPWCPGTVGLVVGHVGHPGEWDGQDGVVYDVLEHTKETHRFLVRLANDRLIQCTSLEIEPASEAWDAWETWE